MLGAGGVWGVYGPRPRVAAGAPRHRQQRKAQSALGAREREAGGGDKNCQREGLADIAGGVGPLPGQAHAPRLELLFPWTPQRVGHVPNQSHFWGVRGVE